MAKKISHEGFLLIDEAGKRMQSASLQYQESVAYYQRLCKAFGVPENIGDFRGELTMITQDEIIKEEQIKHHHHPLTEETKVEELPPEPITAPVSNKGNTDAGNREP